MCAVYERYRRSRDQSMLDERLFQIVEVEVGVEGEGGEEFGDAVAGGRGGLGVGGGAGLAELPGESCP